VRLSAEAQRAVEPDRFIEGDLGGVAGVLTIEIIVAARRQRSHQATFAQFRHAL